MTTKPPIKKPPEKKLFDIRLECLLPATLTYRILAEDPEEALLLMKRAQPVNVKYNLPGKRNIKATVLDAYSSMIRLVRNLVGVP